MGRVAREWVWLVVLVALPLGWFNRVLLPQLTGKTLLPFDNLYLFEPWHSLRPDVVAHNPLISDLVLENVPWALLERRALAHGEVPLWNPDVLAGTPQLTGVWYPPNWLLYALPLEAGFAWFIVLHVALCGVGIYALGRTLGLQRLACLVGAVAFMCGGYVMTSATFPEVLAAAAWTPLLLAVVERLTRPSGRSIGVWIVGALAVGMQVLAGHVETAVYGLLMVVVYGAVRCVGRWSWRSGVALAAMGIVGVALAAVAILPLAEGLLSSVRVGARSADDVARFAWPIQQLWTLVLPDLFGNPTHRLSPESEPVFWGTKNYVEGGQYAGLLTLLLAGLGLVRGDRTPALLFGVLAVVALLLVLGSPLYLVFGLLPGGDQLRTPFRWIFVFSIGTSMLAALGVDALLKQRASRWLPVIAATGGAAVLGALALSLVVSQPFLKLAQRFVTDPAWAERVFGAAGLRIPQALPTAAAFWSYERLGLLRLGVVLCASALVLFVARSRPKLGALLATLLIGVDLYSVHGTFLPQTDIDLSPLRAIPPVVIALDERESGGGPWRFTTFERGDEKTFIANAGMYYGWQDVRGYASVISRQYADFTQQAGLTPLSLEYNRIAPVYDAAAFGKNGLDLLNVRYVLTEQTINAPGFREVYRDGHIRAYEHPAARARAWIDGADGSTQVVDYGVDRVTVEARVHGPSTLVLADSFSSGWRATVTDEHGTDAEMPVERVYETLRGVHLPAAGTWRVTFDYRPLSVELGGAISALAAVVLLVLGCVALRGFMRRTPAWETDHSAHDHPLRAPYSPAGRGA